MSITISYYFNYPKSLVETAEDFNLWMGCKLAPYHNDPSDFYGRFLGMELSLHEHSMENDGELDFENFRYKVSLRTTASERSFRPIQMPTMVFLVYALYKKLSITGMLVYNTQVLFGRYILKEDPTVDVQRLFDVVSNKFVELSKHLEDLSTLIPNADFLVNWEKDVDEYLRSQGRDVQV